MKARLVLTLALSAVLGHAPAFGAGETTYSKDIKAIFEETCAGCHGSESPEYPVFKQEKDKWIAAGKGPRMDTYAHLINFTAWPDTGALMRRLDDGKASKDGKPGNMYEHLGSSDEERGKNFQLFKTWVGNWTHKRWKEISKQDLDGIRVPY